MPTHLPTQLTTQQIDLEPEIAVLRVKRDYEEKLRSVEQTLVHLTKVFETMPEPSDPLRLFIDEEWVKMQELGLHYAQSIETLNAWLHVRIG